MTTINTGTDMSSIVSDPVEKDVVRKSQTREEDINSKIESKIKGIDSLKTPEAPKLPDAPKESDYATDPMKTFGSGASWLAAFGSLLTRHPLATALNAGAEVNKAAAASDANAYKNAIDKWKLKSDYALKKANFDLDAYKEALAEGDVGIRGYSSMMKNDTARMALEMRQNDQHFKDTERQLKNMEEGIKLQALQSQQKYADLSVAAAKEQAEKEGRPFTQQDSLKTYNAALGIAKGEQTGKAASKEVQAANMAKTDWASLKDEDPVGDSGLTLSAVKQAASVVHSTGDFSKAGLGIGWNPAKMAVDNYMAVAYPGFNRARAGLDYAAQKKATNVAAANYANMTIATNNLDNSIPLLKEKIAAVDPSRFKSWNEFENWTNEHAGDPAIVGLKEAITATKSDYQSVIARGGMVTDTVRAEANNNLNKAWNTGQFEEALATMKREGNNQLKSAKESLKEAKEMGLIDEDTIKEAEQTKTPGSTAIVPLPTPKDNKFVVGQYYNLSAQGHGIHKYLGNGEFE